MWLLAKLISSPRLIVGLVVLALLAASHFTVYRKGKHVVQAEWTASVAAANAEARHLEQARQRRADEAAGLASAREGRIRAGADRAGSELLGLRDDLHTARLRGSESLDACRLHTAALEDVFGQCGRQLQEVAREADGHASDSLRLQQSWPE